MQFDGPTLHSHLPPHPTSRTTTLPPRSPQFAWPTPSSPTASLPPPWAPSQPVPRRRRDRLVSWLDPGACEQDVLIVAVAPTGTGLHLDSSRVQRLEVRRIYLKNTPKLVLVLEDALCQPDSIHVSRKRHAGWGVVRRHTHLSGHVIDFAKVDGIVKIGPRSDHAVLSPAIPAASSA